MGGCVPIICRGLFPLLAELSAQCCLQNSVHSDVYKTQCSLQKVNVQWQITVLSAKWQTTVLSAHGQSTVLHNESTKAVFTDRQGIGTNASYNYSSYEYSELASDLAFTSTQNRFELDDCESVKSG